MFNRKMLLLLGVLATSGCSMNLEDTKDNAETTLSALGYEVVGYEGYTLDFKGAQVWYIVKRENSPILYNCFLQKWGDEYHFYNIRQISGQTLHHVGNVNVQ